MKSTLNLTMLFLLISICSCARLADVDKSMINHEAMDLASDMTDSTSAAFTTLSGGAGTSAGCAT